MCKAQSITLRIEVKVGIKVRNAALTIVIVEFTLMIVKFSIINVQGTINAGHIMAKITH